MKKTIIIILITASAFLFLFLIKHGPGNMHHMSGAPHKMGSQAQHQGLATEIVMPENFSDQAQKGKMLFDSNCVMCHGQNAAGGTGNGPPLIHKIYEPGHHADEAFQRAIAIGVRAHHWPFGNMPPISGLTREDATKIISYIREIQRANGIE